METEKDYCCLTLKIISDFLTRNLFLILWRDVLFSRFKFKSLSLFYFFKKLKVEFETNRYLNYLFHLFICCSKSTFVGIFGLGLQNKAIFTLMLHILHSIKRNNYITNVSSHPAARRCSNVVTTSLCTSQ